VELRSVFQDIAADERSHAALAEDVGDWLALQLDDGATQRIALARESALAELWASLDQYDGEPELGLPGAEVARALFTAYFGSPRHAGVA
jgi:hypothetical protein